MDDRKNKEALMKAKASVFRFLKIRQQSEKEIHDKLLKKNFTKETIEQAIAYFKKIKLVDDRQFAQKWIQFRLAKPFGKNRIRFELKNKGIAEQIIEDELKNLPDDYSEIETAQRLARRQLSRYKGVDGQKIKQRLYGYLSRRGFSLETINRIVRNYDRQRN